MEQARKARVGREEWLKETLDVLRESGVGGVKIVAIARRMNLTSGSFYWHFSGLQDLLDAALSHWEHHLTDHIIQDAIAFSGQPDERIYSLMEQVVSEGAAESDSAIVVWSGSDPRVKEAYNRTMERRYEFAAWMFREAGFTEDQARIRGRLMVAYLVGQAASRLRSEPDWKHTLREHWRVLVA